MRKTASIASIVLGALMIVGGIATMILVSSTLREQNIVTPDDACLPGNTVAGPFTAYCQAEIIQEHTLESTGGLTYAELDREDPLREVAQNSAFLQSSLFTSIVAYGVAAMAIAVGLLFILIGMGIRDVAQHVTTTAPPASDPVTTA
ncbi:aromatic ring-opening dioxygenase LigA [Euzebya sp.]|uniref:aromatic ring-opening dioxygenase LigA n=1 Tax=Euzebya sp. TaxID=1971409 RepID=UPI0035179ED6